MRIPIAHALAWPERMATPAQRLDLAAIGRLDFEAPDLERFPALRLAREALEAGRRSAGRAQRRERDGGRAFLAGRIALPRNRREWSRMLFRAMTAARRQSIDDVLEIDRATRARVDRA